MTVVNPFDFFVEPYAYSFPFCYTDSLKAELTPYLETSEPGPLLASYLKQIPREADSTVNFLVELNANLQKKTRYIVRMELGVQTPEQTLSASAGSCRDLAWLLIQILRHLGLAARFVSGYLIQLRPDIDPSKARARSRATSPTCMPGPRFICRGPGGSGSTSPRA